MLKLTRTLRRVLDQRSFVMTTHRTLDLALSRTRRRPQGKRVLVAYEDGEVMDDLDAFDAEVVALDTLLVRLMQERISLGADCEGDARCDLAAFTF